ncbi:unnamed protein product [Prunus armeniaca]
MVLLSKSVNYYVKSRDKINSKRGMHFFKWVDNKTCPRGKQMVPGLLRRLRAMEEEGRVKEENLRSVEA